MSETMCVTDDNTILSYGGVSRSVVLSHAGEHGYIYEVKDYEVKDGPITCKVVITTSELVAAIDRWIKDGA